MAEVAQTLRLNQQTVRNMIDRGELPALRIGVRRVRVEQSALDDFLSEGRRLTKRSPARVRYDAALASVARAIRGTPSKEAADALRALSAAALALASDLDDRAPNE